MAFSDPFAVYHAANNLETHLVSNLLNEADIQATVIEDVSQVAVWLGGLASQIHKPQVWIERADIDRARPVLDEYERRMQERLVSETTSGFVEVTCEECGKQSAFPASQKGSVQDCPHCGAFVDVGEEESSGEWNEVPEDEPADS